MNTELPPDLRVIYDGAIEFGRRELAHADLVERDREERFDREGWNRCAEFGLLAMPFPRAYGGGELGLSALIAAMEALGYVSRDQGLLFSISAHLFANVIPIARFGTEEQKRKYLPRLLDGRSIAANGASEPDAGSDVFAMRTRAERRDNHYVLNGTKTFVTNAPIADLFVVYATVDPSSGPMGVTSFIVERDFPGLSIGGRIEKMGLRTSPMSEVVFDDCKVPVENRLGREGRGADVFGCSMEWERGAIMASCVGAMDRLLEISIAHAQQRTQFGQRIGKFQAVGNRIVDMKVRLDVSRQLVYRVGALKDADKPAATEASVAKLHVSECYVQSCLDAMQVFGGYGYTVEQEIERELRDALASRLYSGTSDIQRNIIARSLGL